LTGAGGGAAPPPPAADRRPAITIRSAEPRDAAALTRLAAEIAAEEGAWLLTTDAGRSVADERRYLRAVRSHADAAVFVAEDDGLLVGRLSLARDPHPASAHVADLGLMVAASHRRRGLGRALLEQAVTWSRGARVTKLELHVFPWNEPAISLYEAFGFAREGLRRRHYLRGGVEVDAVLMAYHLPSARESPPAPAP
jgi:RimJ/RimL family protein N-acetyltransferase